MTESVDLRNDVCVCTYVLCTYVCMYIHIDVTSREK